MQSKPETSLGRCVSIYEDLVLWPIEYRSTRCSLSLDPREDSPAEDLPFSCHLFPANAPQRPGSGRGGRPSRRHYPFNALRITLLPRVPTTIRSTSNSSAKPTTSSATSPI